MILYPEYKGNPDNWNIERLPAISEKILKAMREVGTIAGEPRFRIVNGATHTEYTSGTDEIPAGHHIAYLAMANVQFQDGWLYAADGEWKRAATEKDAPDGVLLVPNYTYKDFGIPRYIVEIYRDKREPGIAESGYQWAWTIETRQRAQIGGQDCEISLFRSPEMFDVQHARDLAGLLDRSTVHTREKHIEKFTQKRETAAKDRAEREKAERDESIERFVRDELHKYCNPEI